MVVVYDATAFDLSHIDETIREDLRSHDEFVAYLSSLAEGTRREFTKCGLLSGLSLVQNGVGYRFEEHDGYGVLQVYCGDRRVLLFTNPDENVEPLVKTASQLLGGM